METALLILIPFLASLLTFFSGFGLGTLLTPVFLYFFPIELAVGMTASVHLFNNVFKLALLRKSIHWTTFLSFAVWALPGAVLGAWLLGRLSLAPLLNFHAQWQVAPLSFIIGWVMVVFTLLEFWPVWNRIQWSGKSFYVGGFLSGFFGGLSGHQGALRSLFLKKLPLSPSAFVATGTAVAVLVDLSRMPVYLWEGQWSAWPMKTIAMAVLSAMAGALLGKQLLKKITWKHLHWTVGAFLLLTGIGLISGRL
jgi:uncharacterized membrane protein YfcA